MAGWERRARTPAGKLTGFPHGIMCTLRSSCSSSRHFCEGGLERQRCREGSREGSWERDSSMLAKIAEAIATLASPERRPRDAYNAIGRRWRTGRERWNNWSGLEAHEDPLSVEQTDGLDTESAKLRVIGRRNCWASGNDSRTEMPATSPGKD